MDDKLSMKQHFASTSRGLQGTKLLFVFSIIMIMSNVLIYLKILPRSVEDVIIRRRIKKKIEQAQFLTTNEDLLVVIALNNFTC